MNVVTHSELSADGAPLLRTGGGGDQEEFLMASFADAELHMRSSDESDVLPLNQTAGTLFVTTKYGNQHIRTVLQRLICSATVHGCMEDTVGAPSY